MTGGYWNFMNRSLASEVFGYHIDSRCAMGTEKHDVNLKLAVKENPLGDPEVSAIVFDALCLLNSYDYAKSGDTDMAEYQADVEAFKQRWLKTPRTKQIRNMIDICTENMKQDLYQAFCPIADEEQK